MNMKMWSCAWMVVTWWGVVAAGDCNITVGDHSYSEEILSTGAGLSFGLAVDYRTHFLYFSFYNTSWYNMKMDLRSKALFITHELSSLCHYTVDQVRGKVHAGCSTYGGAPGGLYQWDSNTGRFELAGRKGRAVRSIHYYNNTLYYSLYMENVLLTFVNEHTSLVTTLLSPVQDFAVDVYGSFIFYNETGLYQRRGDGAGETRYEGVSQWLSALAVDSRGAVYACDMRPPTGLWRLHDHAPAATRLLDVYCCGLTFDAADNIIYADKDRDSIVRLVKC